MSSIKIHDSRYKIATLLVVFNAITFELAHHLYHVTYDVADATLPEHVAQQMAVDPATYSNTGFHR